MVKVGMQNVPLFYAVQLVTYEKLGLVFQMIYGKNLVSTHGNDLLHEYLLLRQLAGPLQL